MRILGHIFGKAMVPMLAVALSALSLSARTAGAATVVVAQSAGASPELAETVSRLRGELLSLGVDVLMADRPADSKSGPVDPRTWLRRDPADAGPDAVIETVIGPISAVDIWIFDPRGKSAEVSRVALEPHVEDAPGRLAIHAVEVLRSNLVAIDLAARDKARHPVVAARVAPEASSAPDEWGTGVAARAGVAAGAGVLTSVDGVGPALLPLARFEWRARQWLVFQATVAGLGTRPTINGAAGSARLSQQYGTAGICLCAPASHALGLVVALSAGVLRTAIEGRADAPAEAHAIRQWSLLVDAGVGARVRLPGRYYLTVAGHLQVAEPYVAIHFVDTLVATTGRPNLLVTLTVGAWL